MSSRFLRCIVHVVCLLVLLPSLHAQKMYWVGNGGVFRANLDGSSIDELEHTEPSVDPLGFDFDVTSEKVFWIQNGIGIFRANLADGSEKENVTPPVVISQEQGGSPEGIAFYADGGSGSLFVTTFQLGLFASKIFRIDLDTLEAHVIVAYSGMPDDIVIDPNAEKMYWVMRSGAILRADLDGSNLEQLPVPDIGVNSIALHLAQGKVYINTTLTISRCDLDGSNFEVLIDTGQVNGCCSPQGIAVDPVAGKIHWTKEGSVYRADLDGQNVENIGITGCGTLSFDLSNSLLYMGRYCGGGILRANSNGSNVENIFIEPYLLLPGIAVDQATHHYYWAANGGIRRTSSDGSTLEPLVQLSHPPKTLVIDPVSERLFWTQDFGEVFRSNLDGSQIEEIVTDSLFGTLGLAVDSTNGFIYWTTDVPNTERYFRSKLDGSDIETFYIQNLTPRAIAIDAGAAKLYWAEHGSAGIFRSNLDGTDVETILPALNYTDAVKQIALDIPKQTVYWANHLGIHRAGFNGLGISTILPGQDGTDGLALDTTCVIQRFGDVDQSGAVDLDDILCTLRSFTSPAQCVGADLAPCEGNGIYNLDDILAQLSAFSGTSSCLDSCN